MLILGAFLGMLVVVLLTIGVHAIFAPQWFHDGFYPPIFVFILPAAATLGVVTQIAWMMWHQGQIGSTGAVCLWGGLIALGLQVALAYFSVLGRSFRESVNILIAWFPITLVWTACLLFISYVLANHGGR